MKNSTLIKYLVLLCITLFSVKAKSACNANFTYTVGSNGYVAFTNLSTSSNTAAIIMYSWNYGDNQNTFAFSPPHSYGANGVYVVTLNMVDSLSASPCTSSFSQTITISNVICSLNAGFNFTVNQSGVAHFINTSTGAIPSTMYNLQFGDNTTANFQNNSFNSTNHTYTTSGTYTVLLSAYNNSVNCFNTYSTVISLTIQPCTLNASFTYTVNNGTINFTNTSSNVSPTALQHWTFGNSNTFFGANPPAQTYPGNGNYQIALHIYDSINTNCSSISMQTVNLNSAPCIAAAIFNMQKDTNIVNAVIWNAYPSYPVNVSGVTWNWGDNSSSSSLYPSHTYSATGFYNICLTVSVSCGSFTTACINQNVFKSTENMQMATVHVLVASPTNIAKNNALANAIRLYPNPVKDVLTIESVSLDVNVLIIDMYGKVVYNRVCTNSDSNINVQSLNAGIYFVKISTADFCKTVKIIKE